MQQLGLMVCLIVSLLMVLKAGIKINRKMLSEMAINDEKGFHSLLI